jgi:hypothetical protein
MQGPRIKRQDEDEVVAAEGGGGPIPVPSSLATSLSVNPASVESRPASQAGLDGLADLAFIPQAWWRSFRSARASYSRRLGWQAVEGHNLPERDSQARRVACLRLMGGGSSSLGLDQRQELTPDARACQGTPARQRSQMLSIVGGSRKVALYQNKAGRLAVLGEARRQGAWREGRAAQENLQGLTGGRPVGDRLCSRSKASKTASHSHPVAVHCRSAPGLAKDTLTDACSYETSWPAPRTAAGCDSPGRPAINP